jgi:GrpB-like predicted nucleotidyltransferase (UPF0157 family)
VGRKFVTDLDEPIHLSEYDPQWPVLFAAEVQRISVGLPAGVTIEHIGSTAVPGLLAKPIDIMLGTEPYQKSRRSGRHWLTSGTKTWVRPAFQVASTFGGGAVPRSTSPWYATAALFGPPISAFRDHLRTSPDARREYAETKRRAFDSGILSLLAYSDYKSAVLSRLIVEALSVTCGSRPIVAQWDPST